MIKKIAGIVLLLMLVMSSFAQQANLVKEVIVQGNSRVTTQAIIAAMSTKVGQSYTQVNLDKDKQVLLDLGLFTAVDIRPTPIDTGATWRITVEVTEQPTIKEIRIVGNTVITKPEILAVFTLKPGDLLDVRQLTPIAKAVSKLYRDKGYVGLVSDFRMLPDSQGTLSMEITETKVGIVSVQGIKLTKPWVMQRLIHTKSGTLFNEEKWRSDLRRILGTGWFARDSLDTLFDDQREFGVVDLTAVVKEDKTGTLNVGVQVDPRSSFAGFIRYGQNNVNGTGKGYDVSYLQTTNGGGPSVDLSYTDPFYRKSDTALQVALYSRILYRFNTVLGGTSLPAGTGNYTERRTGASIGFSRPVNDYMTNGASIRFEGVKTENLDALIDKYGTPNDPSDDRQLNNFIQQDGTVGVATVGSTFDRRDNPNDPSRGKYSKFEIQPGVSNITRVGGLTTSSNILGTNLFGKLNLEYRTYHTFDRQRTIREIEAPRRTIALRTRLGAITGNVPFFEQYFAGGVDTIRGYSEDRFWGKNMFVANLEYRQPVGKAFYLIGFLDYGGAWGGYDGINSFTQSNSLKMHLGYGPGISFSTPLGNIQVYFGFDENQKSRMHFQIGKSF